MAEKTTSSSGGGEPDVDRVLDLTFLDIRDEAEFASALGDKVQQYRARSPSRRPASPMQGETGSPNTLRERSRYAVTDRRKVRAIRLGNNYLPQIDTIFTASQHLLRTENILWLDFSFNNITRISADLYRFFPNVRTINLHANQIKSLPEIKNLSTLTELHSLTLYGNPVEGKKHYKNYTLYYCRNLGQFDKSTITKEQRAKVMKKVESFVNCCIKPAILLCDRWRCGPKHSGRSLTLKKRKNTET